MILIRILTGACLAAALVSAQGPTLPGLPEIKVKPGTPGGERPQPGTPRPASEPVEDQEVLSVQDSTDLLDTETVFRTGAYRVVAPTTVVDRSGRYITNLRPDEFVLFDNGKKQNIAVDVTFLPISLVVAVQASNSVEKILPEIQKIGSMLQPLITGQDGEVAVMAFDHRTRVLQDFTRDPDKITEAVSQIKPGSTTHAFVDAVMHGTRLLRNRPQGHRRVLLMIAENRDRGSETRAKSAITEIEVHNIEIYTVNINRLRAMLTEDRQPPRPDPIPPEARGPIGGVPATPTTMGQLRPGWGQSVDFVPVIQEIFRQVKSIFIDNHAELFTKYSGGREYSYTTVRDLEKAISDLGEHLHSQYLLSYNPNNREEGGWHEIEVRVLRADLDVFSRRGYWTASYFDDQAEEPPSEDRKKRERKEREDREKGKKN
jgi:VWFA-related protein